MTPDELSDSNAFQTSWDGIREASPDQASLMPRKIRAKASNLWSLLL